ncbi:conserved membrane hypothetical protein [Microbacterium sp. 8M]|uniref:hypothetical protein n=1 Tax=Microbacterium sp. 8M TaxID=2653153 RepID=UPI0012EFCC16|nr:hypothetical protein [Microbacterium sp. 8M]VXC06095.1 conserved membrane hypothetical protein [Microbacterium sp. 8M]
MLNNRELASVILIGLLILIGLALPKWREILLPAFRTVAGAFFQWVILRIFGLFVVWVALWVWLAWIIGAWDLGLLKDTIITLFGVGFPLLFSSIRAKSGVEIIGHIRRETLTLSTLFLFYLNLESLPLWGELIAQPVIVVLSAMTAFAQRDAKGRRVVGCFSIPLFLIGIGMIVWTTLQTVNNWDKINWPELLGQLALSVWLPFAMFPYLYVVAFYAATESILKRLLWMNKDMPLRARLGVLVGLRGSVRWTKELTGRYNHVAQARTFRGALAEVRDFREDVHRRHRREADRLANLEGFAGQVGVDGTGAQLDRREFDGTKRALDFIHTAQALRYERLGGTFWDDLTDMVISPASKWGLPDEHGIVVETTGDKKKWRAWRRLPSGWVLGIGATGRFGEYRYAGAEPPTTWPGSSDEWVDATVALGPPDWERNDESRL